MNNQENDIKHLSSIYDQLVKSEGGQHLLEWLKTTADSKRKDAINFSPEIAYANLFYAKALDDVASHIELMQMAKEVGVRKR